MQGPPPSYAAVDANYHVTWRCFAQWVNTILRDAPAQIEAMRVLSESYKTSPAPASGRRSTTSRAADTECASDRPLSCHE
jgi:hypothetical protein